MSDLIGPSMEHGWLDDLKQSRKVSTDMSTLRSLLPQVKAGEAAQLNMWTFTYDQKTKTYTLIEYLFEGEWGKPQFFTEETLATWLDDKYIEWSIAP